MAELKFPDFAGEDGATLAGTVITLAGSAVTNHRTFANAASDTNIDFDDGDKIAVDIIDTSGNTATWIATWASAGATITRVSLEAAQGTLSTGAGAITVYASVPGNWFGWAGAAHHGFMTGLKLSYSSANALTVGPGSAHIESDGSILHVTSTITKSSLTLTADTWYHIYVYDNAGTPAAEVVTTAPAAAYHGTARSQTSDSAKRWVGSVRTHPTSSNTLVDWQHNVQSGLFVWKLLTSDTGFGRVVIDASATTYYIGSGTTGTGDASGVIPATATMMRAKIISRCTDRNFYVADGDTSLIASTDSFAAVNSKDATDGQNGELLTDIPVNSSQEFIYGYANNTGSGSGAVVDVYGWYLER